MSFLFSRTSWADITGNRIGYREQKVEALQYLSHRCPCVVSAPSEIECTVFDCEFCSDVVSGWLKADEYAG